MTNRAGGNIPGMGLKAERRLVSRANNVVYKTYLNPTEATAEASWYQRLPWATPRLLWHHGGTIAVQYHPVAETIPHWKPYAALRELLGRLHVQGIHHRDVHIRNVVQGPDGRPLLIDWESAIQTPSRYSYDLYGPDVSGVPHPEIHTVPQWWGCGGECSIGTLWGQLMYQPLWSQGHTIGKSQRDAEGRYEAIYGKLKELDLYGFTTLDFGAYAGYFSLRLAHEFDARCTAVDGDPHLIQGLDIGNDDRVTGIHDFLNITQVRELGRFDVGLVLSVLHHLPWWRDLMAALVEQCDILFVETANPSEDLPTKAAADRDEVEDLMNHLGGTILTHTAGFGSDVRRPLWHVDCKKARTRA